jgi:hypothetical protein
MTFAAVNISEDAASAMLDRFKAITGLRSEMKGSRLTLTERALAIELIMQHGAKAWISEARGETIGRYNQQGGDIQDMHLYATLLQTAVGKWLPEAADGCLHIVIDEGRYDARILGIVEKDIETMLAGWGQASLANSARSPGVQIADVIANCFFNLGVQSERADRIHAMVAPYLADKRLREIEITEV